MKLLGLLACGFSVALVISTGQLLVQSLAQPVPMEEFEAALLRWGVPLLVVCGVGFHLARLPDRRVGGRLAVMAALAFAALFVWPAYAFAQAAADTGTAINVGALFSDVRGTIEAVAGVVVAAVLGFLSWLVKKNLGISIDQKYRDTLQAALVNGLHSGFDRVQAHADELTVDVKSELVAKALRYARTFAPMAVKHFGLSDADLAEMARAQLAKLFPAEALAAPVSEARRAS